MALNGERGLWTGVSLDWQDGLRTGVCLNRKGELRAGVSLNGERGLRTSVSLNGEGGLRTGVDLSRDAGLRDSVSENGADGLRASCSAVDHHGTLDGVGVWHHPADSGNPDTVAPTGVVGFDPLVILRGLTDRKVRLRERQQSLCTGKLGVVDWALGSSGPPHASRARRAVTCE